MHSPEPWISHWYSGPVPCVLMCAITSADGKCFYCGVGGDDQSQVDANAERIVACVNALAGMSTDILVKILQDTDGDAVIRAVRLSSAIRRWAESKALELDHAQS